MTDVQIVVCLADNFVIGNKGQIPWHLSEDLKHFKQVTMGHPILMGRRTFESIGKILPGRRNILLSNTFKTKVEGLEVVTSFEAALKLAGDGVLMVIGGAKLYQQALPLASTLHLTRVHATVDGDTCFPRFNERDFTLRDSITAYSEKCGFDYTFETWTRVNR
ncbi:MAG: dihydrofolate reductase [Succinivibrio sp.]|nr:dihydrofolate reductase [Succinivibrio sp.]